MWVVHKFGGTSLAKTELFRRAWEIVSADTAPRQAIVVSAMSDVTNALFDVVDRARRQDPAYLKLMDGLHERHLETLRELAAPARLPEALARLARQFTELKEILRGVTLARHAPEATVELVAGHGELWSAALLHEHLAAKAVRAELLDARECLVVSRPDQMVMVEWQPSQTRLDAWLAAHPADTLVITGYIASTKNGIATTLARNGSDFSAAIFARLLSADSLTIWTDVDGVLSADPRLVPEAVCLDELSYDEAAELAYFGAKVVHPSTMEPLVDRGTRIWIRNSFRPEAKGTLIHGARAAGQGPVKGVAAMEHVALVNIEGAGMMGVPGVAERVFGALRAVGISVILISQASSEYSICFAVPGPQAESARRAVEEAFQAELAHRRIERVTVDPECSTLAVIGDGMAHTPGVASTLFSALAAAGINVRAIAQGSSERNISVVVEAAVARRALRAVHAAFTLSLPTFAVGVIGSGRVGAALLDQIGTELPRIREQAGIDLRIRGVLASRRMVLGDPHLEPAHWRRALETSAVPADREAFLTHVRDTPYPHAILIDCTASAELALRYPDWLRRGFHVVTPNKVASAGPRDLYAAIRSAVKDSRRRYAYETTVGAGLPLLRTLRDLVRTGDRLRRIEGVLSGTLSFLFNRFDGSAPFSVLLAEASRLGLTEPDPREDLSGRDVMRKLVILARDAGHDPDPAGVRVESLVPESLRDVPLARFLERARELDAPLAARLADARARGEVLRYVGVLDDSGPSVGLRSFPASHPLARLDGADNMVTLSTDRYHPRALVVQGPGAGPEVTAGGVLADLLRVTSQLGGRA